MTTRARLALLARAYPRHFPRRALEGLLREQLGGIDALQRWTLRHGKRVRASAPESIYHICAGNLAISAITSIGHGLLLGSRNFVKLPSEREESEVRREILAFVRGLPPPLRELVTTHSSLNEQVLAEAKAIIAFGSDATMDSLRRRTSARQRFIAHGHAVSLIWIGLGGWTMREVRKCAVDILTFDQLGCLSPQTVYLEKGTNVSNFAKMLAQALEREWKKAKPKPKRGLGAAARIQEVRDVAMACGHAVWMPPHQGWSIIQDPHPLFRPSPLHGVIFLRSVSARNLEAALRPGAGLISTVGMAGDMSPRSREAFLRLGVTRFCPAGRMQFPPHTWHHDGRPVLGDLVTWSEIEE